MLCDVCSFISLDDKHKIKVGELSTIVYVTGIFRHQPSISLLIHHHLISSPMSPLLRDHQEQVVVIN